MRRSGPKTGAQTDCRIAPSGRPSRGPSNGARAVNRPGRARVRFVDLDLAWRSKPTPTRRVGLAVTSALIPRDGRLDQNSHYLAKMTRCQRECLCNCQTGEVAPLHATKAAAIKDGGGEHVVAEGGAPMLSGGDQQTAALVATHDHAVAQIRLKPIRGRAWANSRIRLRNAAWSPASNGDTMRLG